jgi:hypothetical protein
MSWKDEMAMLCSFRSHHLHACMLTLRTSDIVVVVRTSRKDCFGISLCFQGGAEAVFRPQNHEDGDSSPNTLHMRDLSIV